MVNTLVGQLVDLGRQLPVQSQKATDMGKSMVGRRIVFSKVEVAFNFKMHRAIERKHLQKGRFILIEDDFGPQRIFRKKILQFIQQLRRSGTALLKWN